MSSLKILLNSAHSCYIQDPFGNFCSVVRKWECPALHSTWSHCNLSIDHQSGFRMSCRHSHPSMGPGHRPATQKKINCQVQLYWDWVDLQAYTEESEGFGVHRSTAGDLLPLYLAGEAETWVLLSQADGVGKLPISLPASSRPGIPSLEILSFWTSYHSLLPAGMANGATSACTKAAVLNVNVDYLPVEQKSKVGTVERSEKTLSLPLDAPQVSILPAFPEAYRDYTGEGAARGELCYFKVSYYHWVFLGRAYHNQLTNSSYGDFKIHRRALTGHKVG